MTNGFIAYNIDLAQAENRIVAYIAPEPKMIDAFESGADVHRRTAGLIFNMAEQEVSNEKNSWRQGWSHRKLGKHSNHSLNYDLTPNGFSIRFILPLQQAKWVHSRYHSIYPGVRRYHEWVQNQLRQNRQLTNLFGRMRTFLGRWDDDMFRQAYSWTPQSTVADLINQWGINWIWYESQWSVKEVQILNQVHDSIGFQISRALPWKTHAYILTRLKKQLEQPLYWKDRSFVIPVDCEMHPNNLKEGFEINLNQTQEGIIAQVKETYEREHKE